jgi:hypothetical protein
MDKLEKQEIKPIVTKNGRETWHLIALSRSDNKETALKK